MLVGLLVVAVAPAAAHAEPILSADDAAELANSLAEAREEQGICYGWHVEVNDDSGGPSGVEFGSDRGPGTEVETTDCTQHVVLTGAINYTSESSDLEDSAGVVVDDVLQGGDISTDDLSALGYEEDDLLGGDDDVALMNMVGALPQLAAEQAAAPPIPFEQPEAPTEQQGKPTDSPGNDFVRDNLVLLILGSVLLVLGIAWLVLDWRGLLRPMLRRTFN